MPEQRSVFLMLSFTCMIVLIVNNFVIVRDFSPIFNVVYVYSALSVYMIFFSKVIYRELFIFVIVVERYFFVYFL